MTATTDIRIHRRTWPRRVLVAALGLILSLATVVAAILAGSTVSGRSMHQPVPATTGSASTQHAEPGHPDEIVGTAAQAASNQHGGRFVVAFVAGTTGTVASDLLAPYDIFASSPAFTTYVVADSAAPVPLEGGPAVVPTYTFADVDEDPALTPDLVVVPALTEPEGPTEAPLRRWITRQHDDGARILGICAGAMVLAPTGMLDGLDATSHWSRIKALKASRPAVHWVRGRRYVEDGTVTTTAAVTSGVPAALHLVAELAGGDEAQRVANLHPELDWTPTTSTRIPADHFGLHDWPVGLNFVMPWLRPNIGIALRDGVSELEATAAFEVYTQSGAASSTALARETSVRTQHGLTLLTTRYSDAHRVSRVVVPGTASRQAIDPDLRSWAHQRGLIVEPLSGGFSGALRNLDRHTDRTTTYSTAKMIGYPTAGLDLSGQHRSWRAVGLALLVLIAAILAGLAPAWVVRRRRRHQVEGHLDEAIAANQEQAADLVDVNSR